MSKPANSINALGIVHGGLVSFARVIVTDPESYMVLRLADNLAAAEKAAIEAGSFAHKAYNLKAILNTKIRIPLTLDPTKLFCSQLVAESYIRAGVSLVED